MKSQRCGDVGKQTKVLTLLTALMGAMPGSTLAQHRAQPSLQSNSELNPETQCAYNMSIRAARTDELASNLASYIAERCAELVELPRCQSPDANTDLGRSIRQHCEEIMRSSREDMEQILEKFSYDLILSGRQDQAKKQKR